MGSSRVTRLGASVLLSLVMTAGLTSAALGASSADPAPVGQPTAAAPDAAPAAGQVTTTQEPADCAPTTNAGKPCDPAGPTSETVSPNDAPYSVSLAASALWVPPGAGVMLTATANQDVFYTPFHIVLLNGSTVVGTPCDSGTTCAWTVTSTTPTSRS